MDWVKNEMNNWGKDEPNYRSIARELFTTLKFKLEFRVLNNPVVDGIYVYGII